MDFSGGNLAVRAGADSDTFHFTIEKVLDEQAIDWNLPFPDMDKVAPPVAIALIVEAGRRLTRSCAAVV